MGLQMKCVLLLVVVATLAICADGRPKPKPKLKPKYYDDYYNKNSKKQNYYEDHDNHYDYDDHYDHYGHDDCHDGCYDDHDYHYHDNKCQNYKKPPPPPPPKKCKEDYDYGYKQQKYGGSYKHTCDDDCGCNSGSYSNNYRKKNSDYGKQSYIYKGYKKY